MGDREALGGACSDPDVYSCIGRTATTENRGRLTHMGTDKMFSSKGQDGSYRRDSGLDWKVEVGGGY